MPTKLKKALGVVTDQTRIGLALVSKTTTGSLSAHFDLLVLKATTHDTLELVDDKLLSEIINLTSSSYVSASTCVSAISRRINRTQNWVIALKSLHLIFHCIREGAGSHFRLDAISIIDLPNLSTFCDESATSNSWDYSVFVRAYALYLQERLHCFIKGKIQNKRSRFPYILPGNLTRMPTTTDFSNEMHPPWVMINQITHWQKLLDLAIATRPTGAAKKNHLVHMSFYLVVRESFDLYRDIANGVVLLLDNFFRLKGDTCVGAYYTCVRAKRQFEELEVFYKMCKMMGLCRRSEYPDVQMMSRELLVTLDIFVRFSVKDQNVTFIRRTTSAPSKSSGKEEEEEEEKNGIMQKQKVKVLPDDDKEDDDDDEEEDDEESVTPAKGVVLVESISAENGIEERKSTSYSTAFEAMEALTRSIAH